MLSIINSKRKKYKINIASIALGIFVILSYFTNFFSQLSMSIFYDGVLTFLALFILISNPIYKGRKDKKYVILLIIVIITYFGRERTNSTLTDIIIFMCGAIIIYSSTWDENGFKMCMSIIKLFAIIFAVGYILQYYFRPLYLAIMGIFPEKYSSVILTTQSAGGFTINVGYTAGYINAGIIAYISSIRSRKDLNLKKIIIVGFLLIATLLTGKRGPFIFLVMTIIFCYLIQERGTKRIKRYLNIFRFLLFIIIIYFLFKDVLTMFFFQIPTIRRIVESIEGFNIGRDMTSSRILLYKSALQIFVDNPFFGIGWRMFRITSLGRMSETIYLDTHNIYLQLLCETGILCSICFFITFLLFWKSVKKNFDSITKNRIKEKADKKVELLFFSLAYQTYFLLYGLTGNPLYDVHFHIIYILSCAISSAYIKKFS